MAGVFVCLPKRCQHRRLHLVWCDLQVQLQASQALVAADLLNHPQGNASIAQLGQGGAPKAMGGDAQPGEPCEGKAILDYLTGAGRAQVAPAMAARE